MKNKFSGFTLIESIIMLAIAGLISAILIIGIRNYFYFRLPQAARRIVSDIRYAQKLAETTQTNCGVIFYPTSETYVVYQSSFTNIALDPVGKKPMIRNFKIGDFRNVNIVSAEFPAGTEYIEFNKLGRNSNGGKVTLTYSTDIYEVNVEANTGRVSMVKK